MKKIIYAAMLTITAALLGGCGQKETTTGTEEIQSEQEEAVAETAAVPASEESSDLYSFQISVNGEVWKLPMTFEQLTASGWEFVGDQSQSLEGNQEAPAESFIKDEYELSVGIYNPGADAAKWDECSIVSFEIDEYQIADNNLGITLPGGIEYLKSTKEDIIAAYGEPTDKNEGDAYTDYTYEIDSFHKVKFQIDNEKNILVTIYMKNLDS